MENLKDEGFGFSHCGGQLSPRFTRNHCSQKGPWLHSHASVRSFQSEVHMHVLQALGTVNPTLPGHFRYRTCSAFMQQTLRFLHSPSTPAAQQPILAHACEPRVAAVHNMHAPVISGSSACRSSTGLGQTGRHSQILYQYKKSSQIPCAQFLTRKQIWENTVNCYP